MDELEAERGAFHQSLQQRVFIFGSRQCGVAQINDHQYMKLLEQLLDLVTSFNLRRAFSLLILIVIVGFSVWIVDAYSGYSSMYRLDRTVGLLERLDALERKGDLSKDVEEVRAAVLARLRESASPQMASAVREENPAVFRHVWTKMGWGALPWFLLSLIGVPAIFRGEKNGWVSFLALQIFPVLAGVLNLAIPEFGVFWIDRVLVPLGVMFVFGVIPLSILAASSFKKVREASILKAIHNNLRLIGAAADQFAIENGRDPKSINEIFDPNGMPPALVIADGERYDNLDLRQGQPLIVTRKGGEVVRYDRQK